MNDRINKADVEHVKKIVGDYDKLEHSDPRTTCYVLLGRAMKAGMYLLIRAMEDTAK